MPTRPLGGPREGWVRAPLALLRHGAELCAAAAGALSAAPRAGRALGPGARCGRHRPLLRAQPGAVPPRRARQARGGGGAGEGGGLTRTLTRT